MRDPDPRSILAYTVLVVSIPCAAFLLAFGSFQLPADFNIAFWGVLTSAATVLAVAFSALESHRGRFAVVAAVASTVCQSFVVGFCLHESLLKMFVPATIIAALTLRLFPISVPGRLKRTRRAALAVLALYPAFLVASFVDWPANKDPVPEGLLAAVGGNRGSITAFYSCSLHDFIDKEWLWRIDSKPDILEAVAKNLGMSPCANVPGRFWAMPPHDWPSSLPEGARLYSTPSFPAEDRGPDGDHYFMLIDTQRSRAFVWFKNNF